MKSPVLRGSRSGQAAQLRNGTSAQHSITTLFRADPVTPSHPLSDTSCTTSNNPKTDFCAAHLRLAETTIHFFLITLCLQLATRRFFLCEARLRICQGRKIPPQCRMLSGLNPATFLQTTPAQGTMECQSFWLSQKPVPKLIKHTLKHIHDSCRRWAHSVS